MQVQVVACCPAAHAAASSARSPVLHLHGEVGSSRLFPPAGAPCCPDPPVFPAVTWSVSNRISSVPAPHRRRPFLPYSTFLFFPLLFGASRTGTQYAVAPSVDMQQAVLLDNTTTAIARWECGMRAARGKGERAARAATLC